MLNKHGRIVSKKQHANGVKHGHARLLKAGYATQKGTFKLFAKKA
jgi:hypothetical protein